MAAFIFDLDGTLIDTVYGHVLAWQQAFEEAEMPMDGWRLHRRVGMSGGLLIRALCCELGHDLSLKQTKWLQERHSELYKQLQPKQRPLRGAVELLNFLKASKIPFGIATSGSRPGIDPALELLGIDDDGTCVIDSQHVDHTKPGPDELTKCQRHLGVQPKDCFVVGDAIWDVLAARRAEMFGIGLLSGGHPAPELFEAGAFRVYQDLAELHESLHELGIE